MTNQELNNMLYVIAENEQLCLVCRYFLDCHGTSFGPNGPIFPPCSDWGAVFESGLFNEEDIVEIYNSIIEEMEEE